MTALTFKHPAIALLLLVIASSELPAQPPKAIGGEIASADAPEGTIDPLFHVTGARASTTLTTAIHCSNNDSVPVSIYVSYFNHDNTYACGTSYIEMPPGVTSTFTTVDTAVFLEDRVCSGPPPVVGQGRVEIGTFPLHAKVVCSAQVVSLTGNPPATLSSLDVFLAH